VAICSSIKRIRDARAEYLALNDIWSQPETGLERNATFGVYDILWGAAIDVQGGPVQSYR
jgi:hypothetical protein